MSSFRRSLLTTAEHSELFGFPTTAHGLTKHYAFTESDIAAIHQRRGDHNRLGFAVQLCFLRYPGFALPIGATPPPAMLAFVGQQLNIDPGVWPKYAKRSETRREHLIELQGWLNLRPAVRSDHRKFIQHLTDLAQQTDRSFALVEAFLGLLRQQRIILPPQDVIERICRMALTRGTRMVYEALINTLTDQHRSALDALLIPREGSVGSALIWLRQPPGPPRPKHILMHLDRLQYIQDMALPSDLVQTIHQNRLLKLAREGGQMTAQHLRDFQPSRRYATLVALILDSYATLTDETIDLHDRAMSKLFSDAKRKHAEQFHASGKAINNNVLLYTQIGRALLDAKVSGDDPFAAIEAIIPWDVFRKSIAEAENLSQPENFDYLELAGSGHSALRRYTPKLLEALTLKASSPARDILAGVEVLRAMNREKARHVPTDAPTSFVRKRWKNLVRGPNGLDRRFYELCVLSELRNALRSGDIWVQGSRQFKDFDGYLLPWPKFESQREKQLLGLAIETDCQEYLNSRLALLESRLEEVERLAAADELPEATITGAGRLKITPLDNAVPDEARALIRQIYSRLPRLKITDLLLEVDQWTGFTRHFTHLKSGDTADDRPLLLSTILADAINLGLSKMAESCPGTTYAKLAWLQAWHIRDETYTAGLSELVNAQYSQSFATHWGDGSTSSSDGQNFKVGGRGKHAGKVNLKYGQSPGVQFYTHISDQYAPYHSKSISTTVRDSTHVLDGLLYHETDLRIEEHYTDTAGFTDHVFALMQILGFRFAPRIRDLSDKRLYIVGDAKKYPTLGNMIGGKINVKQIPDHWDDVLRFSTSIKQGSVTASLMLRKLGNYPRQNGLAGALRELGRIERTLFMLEWIQHKELRRRVQRGLNKGEARNALARAVFLNRLGELRDRSFDNQSYRASGLNLVVAAIILWNTVYIERVVQMLRDQGQEIDDELLAHVSPLGWEHINLIGDYIWQQNRQVSQGKFRALFKPGDP